MKTGTTGEVGRRGVKTGTPSEVKRPDEDVSVPYLICLILFFEEASGT